MAVLVGVRTINLLVNEHRVKVFLGDGSLLVPKVPTAAVAVVLVKLAVKVLAVLMVTAGMVLLLPSLELR